MIEQRAAQGPPDLLAVGGGSPRSREKQLMLIVDHCTVAKTLADQIGDKFLAYLLAMSIQEASGLLSMRAGGPGEPGSPEGKANSGN